MPIFLQEPQELLLRVHVGASGSHGASQHYCPYLSIMATSTATSVFISRSDDLSLQHKVDAAINGAMSRGDPDLAVNMAQTYVNSFGNEEVRSMLNNALSRASREEDRQRLEAYQSKLRKRYMPGIKHKKAYVRNTYQYAGSMRLLMRLRQEGKAKTEQRVAEKLAMDLQREYSDGPVSAAEEPHKGTEDKADSPTPLRTSSDHTSTACHSEISDAQVNEAVDETAHCPALAQYSETDPVLEDGLVYSPPKVMKLKPSEHHLNSAKVEVLEVANLPSSPPSPCVEVHIPVQAEPPQKCEIQHLDTTWGERWYCVEHTPSHYAPPDR
ncbi:hypothetical protein HII31_02684 [Pseudocercospora fuligena]|uniref:Uncharacterized protein n=1 Tax=Pseudocercospora fuligena TaxID=685502 RepID=A0A8H6RSE3_9PEZI|nr:hypothetical protein HII31_02684 [Pseudocercospora fuligena]